MLQGLGHQAVRGREQRERPHHELAVDARQELLDGVLHGADDQHEAPGYNGGAGWLLGSGLCGDPAPGLLGEGPGEVERDAVPAKELEQEQRQPDVDRHVEERRTTPEGLDEAPDQPARDEDPVEAMALEHVEELPHPHQARVPEDRVRWREP